MQKLRELINKLFGNTLYVQVEENCFKLTRIEDGTQITAHAEKPFTTMRLGIGNFKEANEALVHAIKQIQGNKKMAASPIVIMHQKIKTEGGLTEVEKRMLREIALSSGAREAHIWVGKDLSAEDIKNKIYLQYWEETYTSNRLLSFLKAGIYIFIAYKILEALKIL